MAATVYGVLLVPAAAWVERLLAGDACGGRVPTAHRYPTGWIPGTPESLMGLTIERARWGNVALAVAWGGTVLLDGRNRAAEALASVVKHQHGRHNDPMHDVRLAHPLLFIVPHRHAKKAGYAVLGGYCSDPACAHDPQTTIGGDWLLPYVGGEYVNSYAIGDLSPHKPGVRGERMVDVRALVLACAAHNIGRVVLTTRTGKEITP